MSLRRTSARLLALALPALATWAPAPAYADPVTVAGCYGVVVVVCDPSVTGVETYTAQVPVCVGQCTYVPVTLVRPSDEEAVCFSYRPLSSTSQRAACGDVYSYSYYDDWTNTNYSATGACAYVDMDDYTGVCGELRLVSSSSGSQRYLCVRYDVGLGNDDDRCVAL